jgi:hypothetical protein
VCEWMVSVRSVECEEVSVSREVREGVWEVGECECECECEEECECKCKVSVSV